MRQKHNHKKHRILTLAKSKIQKETSCQSLLIQESPRQNDRQVDETLQAKDNSHFAPEDEVPLSDQTKLNFKECKIRQLLCAKNYSPTHSDIDYFDTMENYKSYLNKTHHLEISNKSCLSVKQKEKVRAKTIQHEQLNREIKTSIGQQMNKELNMIQQKINRVKTLQSRYNNREQDFADIYDKIQRIKSEERGLKQHDNFCLMSVNQYLKLSKTFENMMGNVKNSNMSKIVCYKAPKKPLSQQAEKWYSLKAYRTERKIDPEGLIKTITLDKSNQNKTERQKLIRPQTVSNFKLSKQNKYSQSSNRRFSQQQIHQKRPVTAPNKKNSQKIKTVAIQINTSKVITEQMKQKTLNSTKFDVNKVFPLRRKVKGVHHVEREKFDWKNFKVESQRFQEIQNSMRIKTDVIFEYPWNWIKFQDTSQIHARTWKA